MDDAREKLIRLQPEQLADALLQLAETSEAAADLVKRLIATPQENTVRFKAGLAEVRRRRGFVGRTKSSEFADELRTLLEDLKAGNCDPRTGVELVAAFYEVDDTAFEYCDDSDGFIGDVFRDEARDLFVHYASQCTDKDWLCDLVLKLLRKDSYGVRDVLIDCAREYLAEESMRNLVERLWRLAEKETDEYCSRGYFIGIGSLARQLKDAPLFEKARLAAWPQITTASCLDIAEVWLDSGSAETALSWLQRIPEEETFEAGKRNRLLLSVYEKLGDREKAAEIAWRIFHNYRHTQNLTTLLATIGNDKREQVIEDETRIIMQSPEETRQTGRHDYRLGPSCRAHGLQGKAPGDPSSEVEFLVPV